MENYTFSRAWSGDDTDIQNGVYYSNLVVKKLAESCMVGQVVMFGVEELPDTVLLCNGQQFARVDYPRLYELTPASRILNADFASVPDLRSQFIVAFGDGGNGLTARNLGDTGGAETHQLTVDEMPEHTHTTQPHSHTYNYPNISIDLEAPGAPDASAVGNPPAALQTSAENVTIDNAGGDNAHENMPPFYSLIFGIVAR